MKTGTTSDRLTRAREALLSANFALLEKSNHDAFVEKLGEALDLLIEVVLNSDHLRLPERSEIQWKLSDAACADTRPQRSPGE